MLPAKDLKGLEPRISLSLIPPQVNYHTMASQALDFRAIMYFFIFLRREICLTLIIPQMNARKQNIRMKSITLSDCEGFFLFHDFKVIYLQHNKD